MAPATCSRCGRTTDQESDEFISWEVVDDLGNEVVCERCVTGAEEQAITEDVMALGEAMKSAGLSGEDVDLETMPDDEFEMRESLAQVFYIDPNEPTSE